jgi:hypothetical protein
VKAGLHLSVTVNCCKSYNNTKGGVIMNDFMLFLLIFFGIVGVIKTASLVYTFVIKKIVCIIFKKNEEDIKIWMKP